MLSKEDVRALMAMGLLLLSSLFVFVIACTLYVLKLAVIAK